METSGPLRNVRSRQPENAKGQITPKKALDFALRHGDVAVAIYSSADPSVVAAAQESYGRERVATAVEEFFGELARQLSQKGFSRIVLGGGETSGAVVKALRVDQFLLGEESTPAPLRCLDVQDREMSDWH